MIQKHSAAVLDTYRRAARLYASVHRTDPFAYGRILCHMLNGIEQVSEVISFAKTRGAHGAAQAMKEAA